MPVFDGTSNAPGARNYVRFYLKPIKSAALSEAESRPVFEPVEYVRIAIPGDKTLEIDKRAQDEHRREYAAEYAAFLANKSQEEAAGTPLDVVGVGPERREEYAYHKIKTVEQLASVSDGNLQTLGPGALKDRLRAKDYLEVMKGNASVSQMKMELEKRDAELAALKTQMAELAAAVSEKRGPGRPPKQPVAE